VPVERVAALLAGAALALFTQWPTWDTAPALAVVNTVVTVAFVLTGVLMAQYREQRGNGRLLALSGIAWSGVWRSSSVRLDGRRSSDRSATISAPTTSA